MADHDIALRVLLRALAEQGFCPTSKFDTFVTYERAYDPVKIQVAPDGSFSAFNGDDELILEGKGPQALYSLLVAKTVQLARARA